MSRLDDAVRALEAGEVVGVPTDTVYGLAVDPTDRGAVTKVFELKGRPADRPLPILVADVAQAEELVMLPDAARDLAVRHWPGALTLVCPRRPGVPREFGDPNAGTVGVRVPDHPRCRELLEAAGPLAVTSANRSGEDPVLDDVAARELFGDGVAVYLPGRSPGGQSSTVVEVVEGRLRVLRRGPIRV